MKMESLTKHSVTHRYLMALLIPALMAGVMQITWPLFEQFPVALFLLAIIFCGWYGGPGPSLLAVLVSIPLTKYFFIEPYFSLVPQRRSDLIALLAITTVGLCASLLSAWIQKEQRRAEINPDALRASEERYRKLAENFPNGTVNTYDKELRITFIAGRGLKKAGLSPEVFINKSLSEIVPPEVVAKVEPHFRAAFAGQSANYECPFPDGRRYLVAVAPLADRNGLINEILVISQDITKHQQAEKALREAEQNYRSIFDNALDGIFRISPEGQFLVANSALAEMFGFDSPQALISERVDISYQHYVDPLRRDEFKRLLEDKDTVHQFEYEAYRKDGSTIWVTDNVRAVRDENGKLLCYEGIANDVTERKRAERRTAAFATLAEKLSGAAVPVSAAQTIADTARDLFGWESCAVKLYDFNHDLLQPLLYIDTVGEKLTDVTPVTSGTKPASRSRLVIDHGAQLTLREPPYEFDEDSVPFGNTDRPSVSVMTVPIRHSSEVIGILSIQSYRPHAYDQEALSDLQALADHCAAALSRIAAEAALRQSEERYRELFENAKDATYVHDLKGRYISVNRAAEKLSGRTRGQIIGKQFSDFLPPEEVGPVGEHLGQKLLDRGDTTYETGVITSDGRRIPVEVSSHLIYENGRAIGVQGTARDITERKHAEERLREYEKVVEGLDEMIVVVDRDYRYLLANRAYLKYRSKNREQVLGCFVPDVVGKDFFEGVIKEQLERSFQGQVVNYELKTIYPELGERDLLASYFPIEGSTCIDRVACVLQDITERKRAEEALRQSEQRFSAAFHSSPAAVSIALLEDGRLLEVNAAFERMTGFSRAEIIGKSTVELGLWSDSDRRTTTQILRERGAIDNIEFKFHKKSGEVRDALLAVELIELTNGPCVLGTAQDVTERHTAEDAQRNYSRQLIEAQETERKNIARELHDQIGQVLTAIHINLRTLWDTCEAPESRVLIDEGVAIVDEALEQVRDLSFELRPSLLDDLGLVAALRWYGDRFARRTGIRCTNVIDLPAGTRLRLELETASFRIVQEALTNVLRHASARNVSISLRSLKNEICLSIEDDGRGFDARSQGLSQFTTHLGLRGMRERARALGGRFEIKSSPACGTEISARFPGQSNKD